MKTAIFKDWDITQIIITPETPIDQEVYKIMKSLVNYKYNPMNIEEPQETKVDCKIMTGQFYACRWWWTRQWESEESIILQFTEDKTK